MMHADQTATASHANEAFCFDGMALLITINAYYHVALLGPTSALKRTTNGRLALARTRGRGPPVTLLPLEELQ